MFMLNLTLAVIWEEFENERERQEADEDDLIYDEIHLLEEQGFTIQDREEAEAAERAERRAAEARAEATGDPVPDPWGPACVRNNWYKLAIHPLFGHFITLMIIANTVTMGLERHNWTEYRKTYDYNKTLDENTDATNLGLSQDAGLTSALEVLNYIFSAIFLLEMIIKMIGLRPDQYWKDHFNKFDATIVTFR